MKQRKQMISELELNNLQVDSSYQRGVLPVHRKIVMQFDADMVGVLVVSKRPDDSLYLVDGQQRRAALLAIGIRRWLCRVVHCDGPTREAEIFIGINGGKGTVSRVTGLYLFRAMIASGDRCAQDLYREVEAQGFHLSGRQLEWPYMTCALSLLRIANAQGLDHVRLLLTTVKKCWPESNSALRKTFIVGLSKALIEKGNTVSDTDVSAWRSVPALSVLQRAQELGSSSTTRNVRDVLLNTLRKRKPAS